MGEIKIELNGDGVRKMLRSAEMKAICEKYANDVIGRLGPGYKMTSVTGKTRVNASIFAETYQAKKENSRNNSILKALGGGR